MKNGVYSFLAIFTKTNNGYVVEFPDLEGCFTQGKTLEEAKKMAEEILEEFLICLKEYKQEIPKATELKRELNENELIEWIYTKLK